MSAIIVYLLMGFILLRTDDKRLLRYPWPSSVWYVVWWLPTETSIWVLGLWAKTQRALEDAVLQVLFDDGGLIEKDLIDMVVRNLHGQEAGTLMWRHVLRRLGRAGLVNKFLVTSPDMRDTIGYSLTEAGIREVHTRGLH